MTEAFIIPDEYKESFRRLLPYMAPQVRNNTEYFRYILIYLKLGGDRLGRIAVDAFNETQRLNDAELKKRLREEELLRESGDAEEEEEEGENEEEVVEEDSFEGKDKGE